MKGARVIFVGPLPPPQHGMAAVNAEVVALLEVAADLTIAPVRPHARERGLVYHLTKSASALRAIGAILVARVGKTRTLYTSADDGLGGFWTLAFLAVARAVGMRIFLHHHSYRYIVAPTGLMKTVVRVMGPHNVHVMLSDEMARDFSRAYPLAGALISVPNAVPEPAAASLRCTAGPSITIGMLSNLTFEKGVADFIKILETALHRGLDVRGRLAGPAVTREVKRFLENKLASLGDRLTWVGAVQDEAKEDFFSSIDTFVFPTRYRTEALPLVIMEALVRGKPTIAPARGSIASYASNRAATIVPLDVDMAEATVAWLVELSGEHDRLDELKATARADGAAMNATYRQHRDALVQQLIRSVDMPPGSKLVSR